MISRNDQVNYYVIAFLVLFIACYCDNMMLVMHLNLMSWDNGKLVASKLIHCCSVHWFSLWEAAAAAAGLILRVFQPLRPFVSLPYKTNEGNIVFIVFCTHKLSSGPHQFKHIQSQKQKRKRMSICHPSSPFLDVIGLWPGQPNKNLWISCLTNAQERTH